MCKHGTMEAATRETVMQGRRAVVELRSVLRSRNMSMEVKRDLRNSIILPSLTGK